jgi:D-alanyl-D-alanine carboxypeptidase
MNLRLLFCILGLSGLSAIPTTAWAQIAPVSSPSGPVQAGPYVVVDAATGETLAERSAGAFWYPASLTKLMTIYLIFEELKSGRFTLATPMIFSEHARSMPPSKLGLPPSQTVTVEQGCKRWWHGRRTTWQPRSAK